MTSAIADTVLACPEDKNRGCQPDSPEGLHPFRIAVPKEEVKAIPVMTTVC
jgi:hypothetical protein